MPRRGEHTKEELRELIFSSAKKIINKDGFQNLSARKLAAKIGYTPGTIYSFFKNIDELVMYINGDSLDMVYETLNSELKTTKDPKKALKIIANKYVDFSLEHNNFWSLVVSYQYKSLDKIPSWYEEKITRNFQLVEAYLKDFGKTQTEAKDLARVLWASLQGIVGLSLRGKLNTTKAKSAQELASIFINNFIAGL